MLPFAIPEVTRAQLVVAAAMRAALPVKTDEQYVDALYKLQPEFDRLGPYNFAKKYSVLVDNSGEDFALEFMSAFNNYCHARY